MGLFDIADNLYNVAEGVANEASKTILGESLNQECKEHLADVVAVVVKSAAGAVVDGVEKADYDKIVVHAIIKCVQGIYPSFTMSVDDQNKILKVIDGGLEMGQDISVGVAREVSQLVCEVVAPK